MKVFCVDQTGVLAGKDSNVRRFVLGEPVSNVGEDLLVVLQKICEVRCTSI